jgi:hypothetical protein
MTRVLGAVLFFFAVVFAIAAGIVATFAVDAHVEQSFLLYLAAAATLVAHLAGEESDAAGAWAPFGVMAFTAALLNASALYGMALVRGHKYPDSSLS